MKAEGRITRSTAENFFLGYSSTGLRSGEQEDHSTTGETEDILNEIGNIQEKEGSLHQGTGFDFVERPEDWTKISDAFLDQMIPYPRYVILLHFIWYLINTEADSTQENHFRHFWQDIEDGADSVEIRQQKSRIVRTLHHLMSKSGSSLDPALYQKDKLEQYLFTEQPQEEQRAFILLLARAIRLSPEQLDTLLGRMFDGQGIDYYSEKEYLLLLVCVYEDPDREKCYQGLLKVYPLLQAETKDAVAAQESTRALLDQTAIQHLEHPIFRNYAYGSLDALDEAVAWQIRTQIAVKTDKRRIRERVRVRDMLWQRVSRELAVAAQGDNDENTRNNQREIGRVDIYYDQATPPALRETDLIHYVGTNKGKVVTASFALMQHTDSNEIAVSSLSDILVPDASGVIMEICIVGKEDAPQDLVISKDYGSRPDKKNTWVFKEESFQEKVLPDSFFVSKEIRAQDTISVVIQGSDSPFPAGTRFGYTIQEDRAEHGDEINIGKEQHFDLVSVTDDDFDPVRQTHRLHLLAPGLSVGEKSSLWENLEQDEGARTADTRTQGLHFRGIWVLKKQQKNIPLGQVSVKLALTLTLKKPELSLHNGEIVFCRKKNGTDLPFIVMQDSPAGDNIVMLDRSRVSKEDYTMVRSNWASLAWVTGGGIIFSPSKAKSALAPDLLCVEGKLRFRRKPGTVSWNVLAGTEIQLVRGQSKYRFSVPFYTDSAIYEQLPIRLVEIGQGSSLEIPKSTTLTSNVRGIRQIVTTNKISTAKEQKITGTLIYDPDELQLHGNQVDTQIIDLSTNAMKGRKVLLEMNAVNISEKGQTFIVPVQGLDANSPEISVRDKKATWTCALDPDIVEKIYVNETIKAASKRADTPKKGKLAVVIKGALSSKEPLSPNARDANIRANKARNINIPVGTRFVCKRAGKTSYYVSTAKPWGEEPVSLFPLQVVPDVVTLKDEEYTLPAGCGAIKVQIPGKTEIYSPRDLSIYTANALRIKPQGKAAAQATLQQDVQELEYLFETYASYEDIASSLTKDFYRYLDNIADYARMSILDLYGKNVRRQDIITLCFLLHCVSGDTMLEKQQKTRRFIQDCDSALYSCGFHTYMISNPYERLLVFLLMCCEDPLGVYQMLMNLAGK